MTKLLYALLCTWYLHRDHQLGILSFLWAHTHTHTHITFRLLYGHSSDHSDYSQELFLCKMVSLQYNTTKRLYSTKTKHNILRGREMISSHLHTLTAPPLFSHFKVKLIHFFKKNLTILRRFKHQVWIYIGIFVLICNLKTRMFISLLPTIISHILDIPFYPVITF